jgi:cytochrome c
MVRFPIAATLLVSLALATPVVAQTADPATGARIAKESCVACHQINADTPAKNRRSNAPSLVDVAKMPSTNERSINVFLRTSHNHMPNIMLTPDEIDSVASYIVGLAH